MKIHHGGKMGDLVLALPAIRAYARKHGAVDLITSALCIPMVPLLWECPYIRSVEIDTTQTYEADGKILNQWEYFKIGDRGINLSPQPAFRQQVAPYSMPPYSYSDCYSMILGVSPEQQDYMIFPALVNHRRWFQSHEVFYKGISQKKVKTVVIAPECESVQSAPKEIWHKIWLGLADYYEVIILRKPYIHNLPTVALMIAEADALIGAHSFPMQLAARIEVPTVCLQDMVYTLNRANPMNANVKYIHPDDWEDAVEYVLEASQECVS